MNAVLKRDDFNRSIKGGFERATTLVVPKWVAGMLGFSP
jgi:hypothetical protein